MLLSRRVCAVVLIVPMCLLVTPLPRLSAQDSPETKEPFLAASPEVAQAIREEGLERSQVMDTLSYLSDVIGPRLTGSPQLKRANEWTRDTMVEWGLTNGALEPWGPFGKGWTLKRFAIQTVEPNCIPLIAFPKAWSPGLDGTLTANVVYYNPKDEDDLERFEGVLEGAVVLLGDPKATPAWFEPAARRYTDTQLLGLADAPSPDERPRARRQGGGRGQATGSQAAAGFQRKKQELLRASKPALLIEPSSRGDGGTIFVQSTSVARGALTDDRELLAKRPWDVDAPETIPQIVMAIEHYNRLVRMIEAGETLTMEVDLEVEFHEDDLMAYNTVAEIPGTDPEVENEVVMVGGHLDSWHCGTGATDNASGCAVAMEAVRILTALDLKPRRTIRVGLWTGEEQGLYGSRAYVAQHFVPQPEMAEGSSDGAAQVVQTSNLASMEPTEAAEAFNVYFNLDNGTGKIRGVYMEGNEAVRPIFRRWLAPFADLGATTLTMNRTGGTDHMSFNARGLPGFQFIQDPIEYGTRTHHSTADVYDRLQEDDMKQASVIMAAMIYNAAMADEKVPRKEQPKPAATASSTTSE